MLSKCLNCNVEFEYLPSRQRGKYCSNACQQDFQSKEIIRKWLDNEIDAKDNGHQIRDIIRDFILKRDNYQCIECGWHETNPYSGTIPLELDHIDGDYNNDRPENLRAICPNCHSLTPNWKSLNRGSGREYRRKKLKISSKKRIKYVTRIRRNCNY